MFRKPSPKALAPLFVAALGLAAPAFAQDAPPPAPSHFPVCSAKVTDNCIQHEPGSRWADHHDMKASRHMAHRTAWKHKAGHLAKAKPAKG